VNLLHYDRSSLLAGKLHAALSRPWVKGRDLYDVIWYLADRNWPQPDLELLNAALAQTDWKGLLLTKAAWRDILAAKLTTLGWDRARNDVFPFLESERDINLVTLDNALGLLD